MMKYLIPPAASIARRCLYALTAFLCTAPLVSQASYLYWAKAPDNASSLQPSLQTCMSLAGDALRGLHFEHVRFSRDEVAGDRVGVYAAITCVGTRPPTAVVMVVGDNDGVLWTRCVS
jgi:hypothetical protein